MCLCLCSIFSQQALAGIWYVHGSGKSNGKLLALIVASFQVFFPVERDGYDDSRQGIRRTGSENFSEFLAKEYSNILSSLVL